VHGAPDVVADVPAQQAGDDDREQELEGDHPEPEPEGSVVGGERDQRGRPAQVGEGVDHGGHDVKGKKDEGHQGEVAVEARGEEARPSFALQAERGEDAEHDDAGEQDQGYRARAAGRIPENAVAHRLSGTIR